MIKYRAIMPIPEKNLLPGQFVPHETAKEWIKAELKAGRIAVYKPSQEEEKDDGE